MSDAIALEEAARYYEMGDSQVKALDRVSFTVASGEKVAIMGPSGSGKTTCMHLIGCLDRPSSGRVIVGGEDTARMSETELARLRNRTVGFVFQAFNLLPRLTIEENVEVPLVYAGVPPRERRARAREALERVGLGERRSHRPTELSGGQRQRAAIARALINAPAILLADEPTGALDSATGASILELFDEINRAGTTIVVVTHDRAIGDAFPRVIRLRDGRLEQSC